MTTLITAPPFALSSPQRRCRLLLMLSLPGQPATTDFIGSINRVDDATTQQDIAEIRRDILRYHRLTLMTCADGGWRIEGAPLNRRLCLLHWLRRALRLCPDFVSEAFVPALKTQLKQQGIARTLYDDSNLQALVNRCARTLDQRLERRDAHFLRLFLQYCLLQHQLGLTPTFTPRQKVWLAASVEYAAAAEIIRHWRRRAPQAPQTDEQRFLALLFMLLKKPDLLRDGHAQDLRLQLTISRLIARFQTLAGRRFCDEQTLRNQLYSHLAQALNRSLFAIGIGHALPEEFHQLYPRLMRTTREALREFEAHYGIAFSPQEVGLIAVIFGAGLMQESDLHEKQVVVLTDDRPMLEQALEQQLRELTLLPITIRRQTLHAFQREGAPKGVALVVTPYTTSLPLFSPPLIHAEQALIHAAQPLSALQCQHIRQMLEG